MSHTALVIGAGYLGQRVANLWQAAGWDVAVTTRRAARAAELQHAGFRAMVWDVTQSETPLPAAEVVLCCVGYDRQSTKTRREVTVDGLRRVLARLPDGVARVLYTSTTSVYHQHAGEWVNEHSPCEPTTENGQLALEAEQLVARHSSIAQTTILRLAGLYGPERWLAKAASLCSGEPLGGNPKAWLNLIHVDDAARVVHRAACDDAPPRLLLVSDQEPVQRCDYYTALAKRLESPEPKFAAEGPTGRTDGLNKRCDSSALRAWLPEPLLYPNYLSGLKSL